MEFKQEWQADAVKLLKTGVMSRREIAVFLGVKRSTCLDFLRKYSSVLSAVDAGVREAVSAMSDKQLGNLVRPEKVSGQNSVNNVVFKIETEQSKEHLEHAVHMILPDSQVKPGVSLDYLKWMGEYIARKKPDVLVHLGDFCDFASLSSFDKGKRAAEGKRVNEDIDTAIEGMKLLLTPLYTLQQKQIKELGKVVYKPRMVMLHGNHEFRLTRHVNDNPELHGFLSLDDLKYSEFGWQEVPFLEPITLNGVAYCHYFPHPFTGKPLGGSAASMLKTLGCSFVQGHKQHLDHAVRFLPTSGKQQHGIIAGACYSHNEDYKGMNNAHWRGVVVAHRVKDGSFDPLFVSLDWLESEYATT